MRNLLLFRVDGLISVYNLPTFSLRSTLGRVKGANIYSLDTSRSAHPSLCIAVKKKLYIYNWDGNDFVEVILFSHLSLFGSFFY